MTKCRVNFFFPAHDEAGFDRPRANRGAAIEILRRNLRRAGPISRGDDWPGDFEPNQRPRMLLFPSWGVTRSRAGVRYKADRTR